LVKIKVMNTIQSLEGWGFDMKALRKSERGRGLFSSSNEVSTRIFPKRPTILKPSTAIWPSKEVS